MSGSSLDGSPSAAPLFRVRTVTAFVTLRSHFFPHDSSQLSSSELSEVIAGACAKVLRTAEKELIAAGYEVQTLRIATNPFEEWLYEGSPLHDEARRTARERLQVLDLLLMNEDVNFCALGPSKSDEATTEICPLIVESSPRFSCSAVVHGGNVAEAKAAAACILTISRLGERAGSPLSLAGGMGNFRFCAAASCQNYIPFFPAAKAAGTGGPVVFGLGLENGILAESLLRKCKSVCNISEQFRAGMAAALHPLQNVCETVAASSGATFLGLDSSLNPSLDEGGSVAAAIETLDEVQGTFGKTGTLSAAAAITTALQSLPNIKTIGYCGLMLPLCEDRRLSHLASTSNERDKLRIGDLLSISSVCGVGIDTVPLPGESSETAISSLILDVAGIADRWTKSLSCRVFPVPGKADGDLTEFDSPYMCNARIFRLP